MPEIKEEAEREQDKKITWISYVALLFAIIFFSGI